MSEYELDWHLHRSWWSGAKPVDGNEKYCPHKNKHLQPGELDDPDKGTVHAEVR